MTLADVVKTLGEHYGSPLRPPTTDPFALILLENVAYLASPARRRDAFEDLKRSVGVTPRAIQGGSLKALERVTGRGILEKACAVKLRECADIAIDRFGGNLKKAISGPIDEAKLVLRTFPGIGEPGAEKILLFAGRAPLLAPDSNALRVLVRLGYVREEKSYARTYAASRHLATNLRSDIDNVQTAHLLLQQHGQTLCKRHDPRCGLCPLSHACAFPASGRVT